MTLTPQHGPLSGIRILEICHMLAGPYCGLLLADLGAEVIKIETGDGDVARMIGEREVDGHNLYFASLNRNKKSVYLDLTTAEGTHRFHRLVASSHGVITNLRPRAIKKLGLTYEALKGYNPKIACLALTGFGLDGPYSEHPAYDYIIQAMTGLMLLTGEPGSPPVRTGYSVVDNSSGMMAALGLLAKLVEGKGGQVDVALYDIMLSQMNYLASDYLNGGEEPRRHTGGGHPFFVPAQIFEARDGHVAIFITHDNFWSIFAKALGRSDWLTDDRFSTMLGRNHNRDLVVKSVGEELRKHTCIWLEQVLRPIGVVIATVGHLSDALKHEATLARQMVVEIATPEGPLRLVGNPIKVDGAQPYFDPPPRLGEHTSDLTGPSNARLIV